MSTETTQIIYSMVGVNKSHEKKVILKDIYLSYYYGAKIGVLGLNGAGKSSLLRIMAGVDKNFEGEINRSAGYSIGFLEQEPLVNSKLTVKEVVQEGAKHITDLLAEYDKVNDKLAEDLSPDEMERVLNRQGEIQEKLDRFDAWNLDAQLDLAMDALRCPPADTLVSVISGGERRRVALCRLLLQKPDILLLDEPTNHLDAESVGWLEQHLKRYAGTVIAVTHDRYFLDNVATWILELDRGAGIPFKGNYTNWMEQKKKRLEIEEKQESARQKALAHELEWVRSSPVARRAKSKARLAAYERMAAEEASKKVVEIDIYIPPGPKLGTRVITAENVSKAFGEKVLMQDVSFVIPPNAVVGIIGPNGAGKTTLFKMITGDQQPDTGTIKLGESVKLAYSEQHRDALGTEQSVWQAISDGLENIQLGSVKMNSRAYVNRFGFAGGDQQRSVGTLSGGERGRVHLARMIKSGANVLLLDEPTNDLDVNTMRALEEAIENFAGCALIISHDRYFLDRVATHIIAFEGDSNVRFIEGDYTAYEEDRHKRLGDAADRPHRISYRKLTR